MKKGVLTNIVATGIFLFVLGMPSISSATSGSLMGQLEAGTGAAGYGTTAPDPRIAVAAGIQIFLGVLGTVFFVLAIYAGFLILTSAGNDEKIGKGKQIIQYAIIGLIVILSAYAITKFVTSRILAETTVAAEYNSRII